MSDSECKSVVVYILYGVLIQTSASFLQDPKGSHLGRLRLKCDGTCTETRFCLSVKWRSPFKLAGASVQSTTGCRGVCISGSNGRYTMFRGSVKGTGYPLHSAFLIHCPYHASPCAVTFHLDPNAFEACRIRLCSTQYE